MRAGEDKRTTLMVKNIPNKYTQKMLLATIDEGFRGHYDFFYLPIDFKNKCNVGYAFINMVRARARLAVRCLHGRQEGCCQLCRRHEGLAGQTTEARSRGAPRQQAWFCWIQCPQGWCPVLAWSGCRLNEAGCEDCTNKQL